MDKKINFTQEQRIAFQNTFREFIKRIDERPNSRTTEGISLKELEKEFDKLLEPYGFKSKYNLGSGNLYSEKVSFAFARQDFIDDKFSVQDGIFLTLSYVYSKSNVNLKPCSLFFNFGRKKGNYEQIYNKYFKGRDKNYDNFETQKEKITNDFLEMLNYFYSFDMQKLINDFEPKFPLNQILYGPPGTGKTYNTIDKALEILGFGKDKNGGDIELDFAKIKDECEELLSENRLSSSLREALEKFRGKAQENSQELKQQNRQYAKILFEYYKEQGQIAFITFHQSFSYEEFVEGIKPNVDENTNKMTYEVQNGIFKNLCEKALSNYSKYEEHNRTDINMQNNIKTEELFQAYAQDLQTKLDEGEVINFSTQSLPTKMNILKVNYFKNAEARSILCK